MARGYRPPKRISNSVLISWQLQSTWAWLTGRLHLRGYLRELEANWMACTRRVSMKGAYVSNSINGGTPRERDFLTNSVSLTFGTYATPSAWQAENAFGGVIASEAAVGRMERTIQVQWHRHHRARWGWKSPMGRTSVADLRTQDSDWAGENANRHTKRTQHSSVLRVFSKDCGSPLMSFPQADIMQLALGHERAARTGLSQLYCVSASCSFLLPAGPRGIQPKCRPLK